MTKTRSFLVTDMPEGMTYAVMEEQQRDNGELHRFTAYFDSKEAAMAFIEPYGRKK